jgi:hypothetical protein
MDIIYALKRQGKTVYGFGVWKHKMKHYVISVEEQS